MTETSTNYIQTKTIKNACFLSLNLFSQLLEFNEPLANRTLLQKANRKTISCKLTTLSTFSYFDIAVYNALCSIYQGGNTHFTIAMIHRVITGGDRKSTLTSTYSQIRTSINKWHKATLEVSDYITLVKPKNRTKALYRLKGTLLDVVRCDEVILNGTKTVAYRFITSPLLLTYAADIGHVKTVSLETLLCNHGKATMNKSIIKTYLIIQIERMAHSRHKHTVAVAPLIEKCFNSKEPKQVQRIKQNILLTLDDLVSHEYITGYTPIRTNQTLVKIEIQLAQKNKPKEVTEIDSKN